MHTALSAFLHTPEWEMFLRASGNTVERAAEGLYIRGQLPGHGTYWRASRIAISNQWRPPTATKGAWFLRLEPLEALPDLSRIGKVRPTETFQPKQTLVLNLEQTEDELLAAMKSKHRYNIRVAERHGVTIDLYHADAPSQFARFWKLLLATAERHAFRTHTKHHYQLMLETLAPNGMAHLGFATLNGEDVAAILFLSCGETVTYLHGGSTTAHKEVMAPFLLQWSAIRWAKSVGAKFYDFWGTNAVQTEKGWEPRQHHRSSGTTRFKLGFGGEIVQFPGAFDLVLKPIPYTLYKTIRKIIRRQSSF